MLVRFAGADLGQFPSTRRTDRAWVAIHHAADVSTGQPVTQGTPFSVSLTLRYPHGTPTAVSPELVKALLDAATAAFQAHGDRVGLREIAERVAAVTGQSPGAIAALLASDQRAVLGISDRLLHLRGSGVQWNPSDHMCVAGQVVCEPGNGRSWTLAGEIQSLRPLNSSGTRGASS